MEDHDQRFKILLQTFFGSFLNLFFPDYASILETDLIEWLEKEIFPDPPQGARRVLDLLAKMPMRNSAESSTEETIAIVLIEIQSEDRTTEIERRLPQYIIHLQSKYGANVLPIVVYLRVGLEGLGMRKIEYRFGNLVTLSVEYLYVGLPKLSAKRYVESNEPIGIAFASLMEMPKDSTAELAAEALLKIAQAELTDQQKFLLGECIEAYWPLDEKALSQLTLLLQTEKYSGVQALNTTTYERGQTESLIEMLQILVQDKFHSSDANLFEQIRTLKRVQQLKELIRYVMNCQHVDEFEMALARAKQESEKI